MLEVREVTTKAQLKAFVKFPFELYKDNKIWVPPLINGEMATFDPERNPNMKLSQVKLFTVFKDGKMAARVAGIINHYENQLLGIRKLRFGWLDFIDDPEVTAALFEALEKWGGENGMDYMEGPVGFSNMDKAGMLTFGFDERCNTTAIYNYPYYPSHMERHGFQPETQWIEQEIVTPDKVNDKVIRFSRLIAEKYELSPLTFTSKKQIKKYIPQVFELLNASYDGLHNFVPLTAEQREFYAGEFMTVVNPDYVSCVMDKEGRMLAFGLAIPSMGPALQKARGRLFPFGWWHLLRRIKKHDRVELILIGVLPQWQKKGLTGMIFEPIMQKFIDNKARFVESNPEQEQNTDVQALWREYKTRLHKRRWTFKKMIRKK